MVDVALNVWWANFTLPILRETMGLQVRSWPVISTAAVAVEEGLRRSLHGSAIMLRDELSLPVAAIAEASTLMPYFCMHYDRARPEARRVRDPDNWRKFKISSICKVHAERKIYHWAKTRP